jgi:ADP-heptose:LPS heptosyltransferase
MHILLPGRGVNARISAFWAYRQAGYLNEARKTAGTAAILKSVLREGAHSAWSEMKYRASPIITIARKRNHRWKLPSKPAHVAVLAPTYLGDCVLLNAPLELLSRNWPDAKISIVTSHIDAIGEMPDNVMAVPYNKEARQIVGDSDVVFVPYFHFGNSSDWRSKFASHAVTFYSDVGFRRSSDYCLAALRIRKNFEANEILNLANLFSRWPLAGEIKKPKLKISKQAKDKLAQLAPGLGEHYAVLQIGSGLPEKDWPVERWIRLAREFSHNFNISIAVIGDKSWRKSVGEELRNDQAGITNLCGMLSVAELIALISAADIEIGACSAPKHIAMALGVPTFCIYGPSHPRRWGALWDRELHGGIVSPVHDLSSAELAGKPQNFTMQMVSVEAAGQALFQHFEDLKKAAQS